MTKKQLRKKMNELIRENNKMIKEKLEKLLKSGAIDLPFYEDNYLLPKLIMCAMAKETAFQFKPLSNQKEHQKDIENFYTMM